MSKKKNIGASKEQVSDLLAVDHSFDDAQIAAIGEAGLEPAQVRQEIGLESVKFCMASHNHNLPKGTDPYPLVLSFSDALARAKEKYAKT